MGGILRCERATETESWQELSSKVVLKVHFLLISRGQSLTSAPLLHSVGFLLTSGDCPSQVGIWPHERDLILRSQLLETQTGKKTPLCFLQSARELSRSRCSHQNVNRSCLFTDGPPMGQPIV